MQYLNEISVRLRSELQFPQTRSVVVVGVRGYSTFVSRPDLAREQVPVTARGAGHETCGMVIGWNREHRWQQFCTAIGCCESHVGGSHPALLPEETRGGASPLHGASTASRVVHSVGPGPGKGSFCWCWHQHQAKGRDCGAQRFWF